MSKSFKDRAARGHLSEESDGSRDFSRVRRLEKAKDRQLDFRCSNCRLMVPAKAPGTQHRNHCPTCLWSRHVDSSVGVRLAVLTCGRRMRPLRTRLTAQDVQILHQCEGCGHEKWNRIAADDNIVSLLQLETESSPEAVRAAICGRTDVEG